MKEAAELPAPPLCDKNTDSKNKPLFFFFGGAVVDFTALFVLRTNYSVSEPEHLDNKVRNAIVITTF